MAAAAREEEEEEGLARSAVISPERGGGRPSFLKTLLILQFQISGLEIDNL